MLLIDGVKYEEWTDLRETEDLEPMVVEHSKEIFGDNTEYFDIKKRLESSFGRNRIPDGYVVDFNIPAKWHVVEIELSNHPIDTHIREQVNDFITATQKIISNNRHKIVDEIFNVININHHLRYTIEHFIKSQEIHKFLTDLILYTTPCLTIIIEKKSEVLEEELKASLRYFPMNVIEFKTFRRVGAEVVHTHMFEPLYKSVVPSKIEPSSQSAPEHSFEVALAPSCMKYHYIHIPKPNKNIFPNSKTMLDLTTDIGSLTVGFNIDPEWGSYIQKDFAKWFKAHPELKAGDKVRISVIEPMKRYRLEILK
jgi:hypothetical protein